MESQTQCTSCFKVFSTKSNLLRHVRTVNQCGGKGNGVCEYCRYTTRDPQNLQRHKKGCEMKKKWEEKDTEITSLKKQLKSAKQEIVDLKIQLSEKKGMLAVKSAPRTVNNNYVNQKLLTINCSTIDPLTVDTVKKSLEAGNYSFQHFKLGPDGIVDFIADIICTEDGQRNYACSDVSRNKCHRLIETREWQSDNGATFINKILDQLRVPAIEYNKKVIEMWDDEDERDTGDELREKTREMVTGITDPKSVERKELFSKVRAGVKKLAAV